MMKTRRKSSSRWWNKKKIWILLFTFLFLIFIRISKSSTFRDIYYFVSKPFWPGEFQRELLLKSIDQELNIKLNQLEKDNLRLRELLSLKRSSNSEKISSSVISRNMGNWWKKIIINKGKSSGVQIGDAVIGPGGLLGIIEDTSALTSSVKLLTSPESKVGVWIQRSNIHGLLVGTGNDTPELIFYEKGLDIKVGDFVLSSPASTLLPPNISVGIIQSVNEEIKPITKANVKLIANPQAIDWVQIIKLKI